MLLGENRLLLRKAIDNGRCTRLGTIRDRACLIVGSGAGESDEGEGAEGGGGNDVNANDIGKMGGTRERLTKTYK